MRKLFKKGNHVNKGDTERNKVMIAHGWTNVARGP